MSASLGMQGAVLPLHRGSSGHQKRGAASRRLLTSSQLQGVAFFAFLSLLCVYVAYYVRTITATAARQQAAAEEHQGMMPVVPGGVLFSAALPDLHQLPEPLRGPDDDPGGLRLSDPHPSVGQQQQQSTRGFAAPAPAAQVAFSSFRHPRRDGQFSAVRPHPHQQAPQHQQQPQQQQQHVQLSASGVGQQAAKHMANREHAPIQVISNQGRQGASPGSAVVSSSSSLQQQQQQQPQQQQQQQQSLSAAALAAAGQGPQKLETAMEKTTWLVAELQAHYKRACVDSSVTSGSVPAQACSRLTEIGISLGNEQHSSSGARFVAAMQSQAFPLIEIVRQSIGAARPGSDVVLRAATVMKELSNLGRMDVSAAKEVGIRRASMFGDDFLDAHVGSHFEESGPAEGGAGEQQHPWRQEKPRARPPQDPKQAPMTQRRQEQRDALRAHQQISIGQVGFNSALVAGSSSLVSHRAGARHAADGAQQQQQLQQQQQQQQHVRRRRGLLEDAPGSQRPR